MDEQQRIQQSTDNQVEQSGTWDDTADGAAYSGYDDEMDSPAMSENDSMGENYGSDDDFESELEPEGARLDDEGNVSFGDNFFGDVHERNSDEEAKPNYYTPEELRNTPWEQWDEARLDGNVRDFVPIVREQLERRNAQSRAQTIENIPMPQDIQEVKPYTPHELSEDAMKLACEKLGLEDPEDFDDYEAHHRAAMQLAMNELMEKRNAEVAGYRRGQDEWGQLQKFNAGLSQRPDFNEFNQWYMGKLQEAGVTAEQINAGLYQYARKNGNRFSAIPQIISSWYTEFQRERGGNSRGNYQNYDGASSRYPNYDGASSRYPRYDAQTPRYPNYDGASSKYPSYDGAGPRRAKPPVLESTRGNDYSGRRRVNLQSFGDMDNDEQATALMNMGLV